MEFDRVAVGQKINASIEHSYSTHRVQQRILFDLGLAITEAVLEELERKGVFDKPVEEVKVKKLPFGREPK